MFWMGSQRLMGKGGEEFSFFLALSYTGITVAFGRKSTNDLPLLLIVFGGEAVVRNCLLFYFPIFLLGNGKFPCISCGGSDFRLGFFAVFKPMIV